MLDISGKIDEPMRQLLLRVHEVLRALEVPYIVIGAAARDMIMHYAYGAAIQRATQDIDFAMQVPDWNAFETCRAALVATGFEERPQRHRLRSPERMLIDIVPFGGVENAAADIHWPPDGVRVMNMLGFREALESAEQVRIQSTPPQDIPVVTPPGLTLLKLVAWTDRARDLRQKDARDLVHLFREYATLPPSRDAAHDDPALMEFHGWNIELAAAQLLGRHVRAIASDGSNALVHDLLRDQLANHSRDQLIIEMCSNVELQYDFNETLLAAFTAGYLEGAARRP